MSLHVCSGSALCDTPGLAVDTTGYLESVWSERVAQIEMKSLPTEPCPDHKGVDCPRCAGYNLVISGRRSFTEINAEVVAAAVQEKENMTQYGHPIRRFFWLRVHCFAPDCKRRFRGWGWRAIDEIGGRKRIRYYCRPCGKEMHRDD